MGFLGSGFGAGGLVVMLIVRLIDLYQWRTTLIILGLGMWALGIPLSLPNPHIHPILRRLRRPADGISYRRAGTQSARADNAGSIFLHGAGADYPTAAHARAHHRVRAPGGDVAVASSEQTGTHHVYAHGTATLPAVPPIGRAAYRHADLRQPAARVRGDGAAEEDGGEPASLAAEARRPFYGVPTG